MQLRCFFLLAALLIPCALGGCGQSNDLFDQIGSKSEDLLEQARSHIEQIRRAYDKPTSKVPLDRVPTTFTEAEAFIERMDDLTAAGKFDEVAALLTYLEAAPDSAQRQTYEEARKGTESSLSPVMVMELELPMLLNDLAKKLDEHKQYALSERVLQKALAGRKTLPGQFAMPSEADLEWHLANARFGQGKYDQIAPAVQRKIAAGPEQTYKNCKKGEDYLFWRKYSEAEQLFKKMYELSKDDTGHDNRNCVFQALRGLGKCYYMQGRYSESCNSYGEALTRLKQADWQTDAWINPDFSNYSKALRKAGRTAEADAVDRDKAWLRPLPEGTHPSEHFFDLD